MNAYSQNFININANKVKRKFNEYNKTFDGGGGKIVNTDSSISFLLRDSLMKPLDIDVYFDETGLSYKEIVTYQCDSCYQKHFASVLNSRFFKWVKVTEGVFITMLPSKYILTQNPNKPYSSILQKLEITNQEFNRFKKNIN
jgi:hypothetical protein